MKQLLFAACFFAGTFITNAQESVSLYINVVQSNNNYRYHEIFNEAADPNEIIIFPTTDQYGLSFRKESSSLNIFEFLFATKFEETTSRRINVPYEERNMLSYNIDRAEIHFRVEYGKMWKIPKNPYLRFGLTGSFDPRFTTNKYEPLLVEKFASNFKSYEATLNVIPTFSYNINNRFVVNLKVPIELANLSVIRGTNENPSLSSRQRTVSKTYMNALDFYRTYTFSIGYFISHADRIK